MEKNKQDGNKNYTQKRYYDALEQYNQGLETVNHSIVIHLKQQASALLHRKSTVAALACCICVIRLKPSDQEALLLYAECLASLGLDEAALLVCLHAVAEAKTEEAEDVGLRILDKCRELSRLCTGEREPLTTSTSEGVEDATSRGVEATTWETEIPVASCLPDVTSVATSLPDPDKEGPVVGTILSNAAACELALKQPHLAAASSFASLLFPCSTAIKAKAAFRLCTALIQSCSFRQASEALDLATAVGLDIKEVSQLRECLSRRQAEATTGSYDWEAQIRAARENPCADLDCAPFLGPVRIVDIPNKGCGLQASKDIKTGELLLVTHAYYACHRQNITHLMKGIFERVSGNRLMLYENANNLFFLTDGVNPRDIRASSPQQVLGYPRLPLPLLPRQLHSFQHDADVVAFLQMAQDGRIDEIKSKMAAFRAKSSAAQPLNPSNFKTMAEKMKFGEKLVGIVNTNMMHHAQMTCPLHILESQEEAGLSRYSTDGLWILPSFLNTGSVTNVHANCLGDVLVCRAARDVREGEELLVNYTIEREWSKREEFMEHHGIPMPPDVQSPLKGKSEQLRKIDTKIAEVSDLISQSRSAEAMKSLNSIQKKHKNLIQKDLLHAEILHKKAKCRSLLGDLPSQVLPILFSALEAERSFRPFGSDYLVLVSQWLRFPGITTAEKQKINEVLDDLARVVYGLPWDIAMDLIEN